MLASVGGSTCRGGERNQDPQRERDLHSAERLPDADPRLAPKRQMGVARPSRRTQEPLGPESVWVLEPAPVALGGEGDHLPEVAQWSRTPASFPSSVARRGTRA